MTNFEYWKDRILEITENDSIAVVGGKPVESKCFGKDCAKCDFVCLKKAEKDYKENMK